MVRGKTLPGDKNTKTDTPEAGKNATDCTAAVDNSTYEQPCLVVGIGASAGGQAALEQLFTSMPANCGLSFVVVMHLHPDGPSYLHEILGRCTSMPVMTAADGMSLQPDTVLVIPPGVDLTVAASRIKLDSAERTRGAHHPIDSFFESLAADTGSRTVAVLLSGFGIDGSAGVKAVKEAGGAVLVQEPASAVNPAMPGNAIATGAVDFILPAEEIAAKIAEIARGVCFIPHRSCHVTTLDDELGAIFRAVKLKTGHDFSSYKANTVMRRIERRMAINEVSGIGKYVALIEEDPKEALALCQDILIGVTSFFRDPDAFEVLRQDVIPRLFVGRDPEEPVRIWHACCATGEEVYSVAILIQEYLLASGLDARVQLFATDIDDTAIAQARAGIYPDDIEQDLGRERLERFFVRTDGHWQVKKQLREMVVFAHHSLIKDPPFSRLDLLVCRNFLIYLNPDMQKRLITLFHQVLKNGAVLFLGSAETVGRNSELFSTIDNKWKLFERLEGKRKIDTVFPIVTSVRMPTLQRPTRPAEAPEPSPGVVAERLLMERYSPPCVVVNDKFETVHVSTRLNRFLEVPTGEPTRDILRMAREDLRPTLRAAIYKAFAEQKPIEFCGVKVVDERGGTTINLIVEPLGPTPGSRLAMVIFEQGAAPATMTDLAGAEGAPGGETSKEMLILQLEEQLRVTHEQLQATSEQLETSNEGFMSANEELMSINEEFQSANEELQSTNEELETSKEELQALNEELITVNSELQGKVEELNQATSDRENLLASSGIATLFLDRELHIKGFTPAVAGIFNLIPADIGRPFRHFAGKIDWPTLASDAETVLAGQPFTEREVMSLDRERCYLKRIFPYRTQEGVIDGIVVTFVDITERKLMEEQTAHLASFPQLNPNPVLEVDAAGLVIFSNPAARKIQAALGMNAADINVFLPADLDEILSNWDRTSEVTLYREISAKDRTFGVSVFLTPQFGVARIYAFDITERKRAEVALAESEQRVRHKLESIISPEGDIGDLELSDIIDASSLQALVDDFYELTGMPMGLIDLKGEVLVGVGWQDACTKFHRLNPDTLRNCVESDIQLSAGVPHGEYKIYKCKNNMWDVATPVMVGDRHFGNLFMGQFLFEDEPLDYEFFRLQASKYGFDEKEYIACLEAVPRLSRETLNTSMAFFMKLADILSKLSYSNLKLARSLAERERAEEELRASNEELTRFNDASVGRELRMIELKKEINEMCGQEGLPPRYPLDFDEEQP
jgi:two-component system CheB/CheR fusion protein